MINVDIILLIADAGRFGMFLAALPEHILTKISYGTYFKYVPVYNTKAKTEIIYPKNVGA